MIQSTANFLPVLPESGHLGSSILYFHPPTITKRRKAPGYYWGNYFLSVFNITLLLNLSWPGLIPWVWVLIIATNSWELSHCVLTTIRSIRSVLANFDTTYLQTFYRHERSMTIISHKFLQADQKQTETLFVTLSITYYCSKCVYVFSTLNSYSHPIHRGILDPGAYSPRL